MPGEGPRRWAVKWASRGAVSAVACRAEWPGVQDGPGSRASTCRQWKPVPWGRPGEGHGHWPCVRRGGRQGSGQCDGQCEGHCAYERQCDAGVQRRVLCKRQCEGQGRRQRMGRYGGRPQLRHARVAGTIPPPYTHGTKHPPSAVSSPRWPRVIIVIRANPYHPAPTPRHCTPIPSNRHDACCRCALPFPTV